jgi:hypothetical protein
VVSGPALLSVGPIRYGLYHVVSLAHSLVVALVHYDWISPRSLCALRDFLRED